MINLKLVHLLLDPNYPADIPQDNWNSIMKKQNDSIESIGKIKSYFKSYTQQFSRINRTELPKETCAVPEMVQEKLNDNINDVAISYGHYGAFKAHERAVKNEFSNDVDGIIIFEGDVILDVEPDEFINSIINSYKFGLRNDASFITFGELKLGIRAEDPWKEIKDLGDFIEVPHFLCCHSYLIFKKEQENIKHKLNTSKWHAWDIWLFWNYDRRVKMYSHKKRLVTESDGYSAIDFTDKVDGKYS
jgi:GR25 family glycosyltransferase involved in LPS biosynthesis